MHHHDETASTETDFKTRQGDKNWVWLASNFQQLFALSLVVQGVNFADWLFLTRLTNALPKARLAERLHKACWKLHTATGTTFGYG